MRTVKVVMNVQPKRKILSLMEKLMGGSLKEYVNLTLLADDEMSWREDLMRAVGRQGRKLQVAL